MASNALERLQVLAPPPREPVFAGSDAEWEQYLLRWKVEFPADYLQFVKIYGTGGFYNELAIATPFRSGDIMSSHFQMMGNSERITCFETGNSWPYWPAPGGMLYVGGDSNGNSFYWKTDGPPDDWKVWVFSGGFWEEESYDCGIIEFVTQWLERSFASNIVLPSEFYVKEKGTSVFVPHRSDEEPFTE